MSKAKRQPKKTANSSAELTPLEQILLAAVRHTAPVFALNSSHLMRAPLGLWDRLHDPRPGDWVIITCAPDFGARNFGRIVAIKKHETCDFLHKYFIEHADGSLTQWHNCKVNVVFTSYEETGAYQWREADTREKCEAEKAAWAAEAQKRHGIHTEGGAA